MENVSHRIRDASSVFEMVVDFGMRRNTQFNERRRQRRRTDTLKRQEDLCLNSVSSLGHTSRTFGVSLGPSARAGQSTGLRHW